MSDPIVIRMTDAAHTSLGATGLPQARLQAAIAYQDAMVDLIAGALVRWKAGAILVDVRIDGVMAQGGRVSGPDLEGLLRAGAPAGFRALTLAFSTGLRDQFRAFERALSVPRSPWYPAFGHVRAAQAAPALNLPSPLTALATRAAEHLSGERVIAATQHHLGAAPSPDEQAVLTALGAALDAAIPSWLAATLVTQVIGTGPVPSYAPPQVPGGPVVGGVGAMRRPGGFF